MNIVSPIDSKDQVKMSWQVVDMARKEGPLSLNPDGMIARIARALFGISTPRRLANEGLEALRRFSVRAWFWDYVPAKDVQDFLGVGYTVTDAERVLAYVAHHRGFTPTLLVNPG